MSTTAYTWKPADLSMIDVVFGAADRVESLLPAYKDIPKEFDHWHHPLQRVASAWFFNGVNATSWVAREGISKEAAIRHVQAVIGSFGLKHEHKMAGVAFLLDQFFSKVEVVK